MMPVPGDFTWSEENKGGDASGVKIGGFESKLKCVLHPSQD